MYVKRVNWYKTKETYAHILIDASGFATQRIVGGMPLLPESLDQLDPLPSKMAIFNLYSLVAPRP